MSHFNKLTALRKKQLNLNLCYTKYIHEVGGNILFFALYRLVLGTGEVV
jgi:hypothetical protein